MADPNILPELLTPRLIPLADLTPDPANARRHPDRNMQAVMASLRVYGQHQPIVVQKQGMIVRVGNARLEAARLLGWDTIAAVVVDETDIQAVARAIADNRTSELAEWDDEMLADQLQAIEVEGIELEMVGYDTNTLAQLLESLDPMSNKAREVAESIANAAKVTTCPKCGHAWSG